MNQAATSAPHLPQANAGTWDFQSPRARWVLGCLVALVTLLTFWGVNACGFTNWDDSVYVYQNPDVTSQNYKGCLTKPVINSYTPLPQVVFAWEWGMVASQPVLMKKAWLFHFTNWLLHVLTTVLVFGLMQRLGLRAIWAALVALLFGIHPLRVESVAWVTELKDLLYGLFYVATLVAYLEFVRSKKRLWWALSLLLFLLSLLSKVQAATLPIALLAIDWYQGRKVDLRNVWSKAPYFIASLALGILGLVMVLQLDRGLPPAAPVLSAVERMLVTVSVFGSYLLKQFIPYAYAPSYPTPTAVGLGIYVQVAATLGVVAAVVALRKRSRAALFGLIFFGSNVIFMLANGEVSNSFMADRFTYIPSIGVFFALLMTVQRLTEGRKTPARIAGGMVGAYALLCIVLTASYVPAWQTSFTLWDYVVQHYPRQIAIAYTNRADYYGSLKQYEQAQADYDVLVEVWPDDMIGYLLRGRNQFWLGRYAGVVDDETVVIKAYPASEVHAGGPVILYEGYFYRGMAYLRLSRESEAIADLSMALRMRPDDLPALRQRGDAYLQAEDMRAAIGDFSKIIALDPSDADAYNRRGYCYMNLKELEPALLDFNQAVALAPENGLIYNNRAFVHALLGDKAAALQDASHAQQLGFQVEREFLNGLR